MNSSKFALLFVFIVFLFLVQSSSVRRREAPNLRAEIPPLIPELPIPPRLCYQEGRLVGVYYNGKVYPVDEEQEPEPAQRSPIPPPHLRRLTSPFLLRDFQMQPWINPGFPEGARLYRNGRARGTARDGWMWDFRGQPITRFGAGDVVKYYAVPFAIYDTDRFILVNEEPEHHTMMRTMAPTTFHG